MNLETPRNANFCLGDEIGFVALVQHIGNDCSIVNAARCSFGKQVSEVEEKDRKLIKYLLEHNHGTPFEHNSLTFLVKCPLFIARQWHRHRIASINEISARYVEVKDEFYIPAKFRKQSTSNRQASVNEFVEDFVESEFGTLENPLEHYKALMESSFALYKLLLEAGVCREQARAVLPLATYTQFYWTVNLRAFLHFVELRNHPNAQWEIQQYAKAMLEQVETIFPHAIEIWKEVKAA